VQEPNNAWDFFSHSPEATHQFTWLFGDRGIPASYRHLDGFGSHTFQWVNAAGVAFWVKYHFKTDQGIETLTTEEAQHIGGGNPNHHHLDLLRAIERGEFPSWTVKVQLMPVAEAARYRFNPFDLTKVWPHADYPLMEIGKLTLNRNPDNYFAEVEQSAFNPGNFVPGIGPSPDKMLQGRLFSYGDAHRYRLGVNHTQLPVNCPHATKARNYGRDGATRFDDNGGRAKNYEPNSYDGPAQSGETGYAGMEIHGVTGSHPWTPHPEDNDFVQAGNLYRIMSEAEKQRLVANIVGSLAAVTRDDVIQRAIGHFRNADADYGQRITLGVEALRASHRGEEVTIQVGGSDTVQRR
jgi:catalase